MKTDVAELIPDSFSPYAAKSGGYGRPRRVLNKIHPTGDDAEMQQISVPVLLNDRFQFDQNEISWFLLEAGQFFASFAWAR